MNTRKKRKFKIHTGSLFEMPFKRPKKKFFKVFLVGTLNLCLKEPEKMQKTRNQSDHPRQRKRPKTGKILPNSNFALFLAVFWSFLGPEWSDSSLVFCICSGSLRHKFRVPTRHTLKKFFFWPFKGLLAILKAKLLCGGTYLRIVLYDFPFYYLYRHTKAGGWISKTIFL